MSEQPSFRPPDSSEAQRALQKESQLPLTGWQQEVSQGLAYGLEGADSIRDRSIKNFQNTNLNLQ